MTGYYRRGRLGCSTVLLLATLVYVCCRYWILQAAFIRLGGRQ